jgi:hypothetical protein
MQPWTRTPGGRATGRFREAHIAPSGTGLFLPPPGLKSAMTPGRCTEKETPESAPSHERFQAWCSLLAGHLTTTAFVAAALGPGFCRLGRSSAPGEFGARLARNHRSRRTLLSSRLQLRLLQRSLPTRRLTWSCIGEDISHERARSARPRF